MLCRVALPTGETDRRSQNTDYENMVQTSGPLLGIKTKAVHTDTAMTPLR